jgi:hypothetical protein
VDVTRSSLFQERRIVMVMDISLSDLEVRLLRELLQGDLCRLLLEIAHTDHRSMKEGLKAREGMLQGLIQKLESKGWPSGPGAEGSGRGAVVVPGD